MSLAAIETRSQDPVKNGRKSASEVPDTRFDRRLADVLAHASRIFWEKGYEGASMRDLSRATGMSLAGLYHYFESKEELLYLIQKHTFTIIIERLRQRLEEATDPEERIRIFIHNHLEYFLANKEAMKVLTHEDETLKNGRGAEIAAIKRDYYRICLGLLEDLRSGALSQKVTHDRVLASSDSLVNRGPLGRRHRDSDESAPHGQFSTRLAVLSLFGMINWIYTWHNPRIDADANALARQMGDLFLHGVMHAAKPKRKNSKRKL